MDLWRGNPTVSILPVRWLFYVPECHNGGIFDGTRPTKSSFSSKNYWHVAVEEQRHVQRLTFVVVVGTGRFRSEINTYLISTRQHGSPDSFAGKMDDGESRGLLLFLSFTIVPSQREREGRYCNHGHSWLMQWLWSNEAHVIRWDAPPRVLGRDWKRSRQWRKSRSSYFRPGLHDLMRCVIPCATIGLNMDVRVRQNLWVHLVEAGWGIMLEKCNLQSKGATDADEPRWKENELHDLASWVVGTYLL